MSTQRYISTSFWDDEWIASLDPSEKLLYLYFMTNPLTNIAGIYKITERRISFDTGFNTSTIQHIMAKFEKAEKVFRHGEWVIIPSWPKHQKVNERDNNRKGINAILRSLPDEIFALLDGCGYRYEFMDQVARPNLPPESTTTKPVPSPSQPLKAPSKPLEAPSKGDTRPSNYSDIDFDLDIDLELDNKQKSNNAPPVAKNGEEETAPPSTAVAVIAKKTAVAKQGKESDLPPEQLAVYHALEEWFKKVPAAEAVMYKDRAAAARTGKALKTITERCFNLAKGGDPEVVARAMMEAFYNAVKTKGAAGLRTTFSPVSLATEWVWDAVFQMAYTNAEIATDNVEDRLAEIRRRRAERETVDAR